MKTVLDQSLSDRLIARMCKEHGFSREASEAVLRETDVFLRMIAANPGCPSSPSPLVDIGWHTFILYTREYAAYCQEIAGHFIHHCPTDTPELEATALTSQSTVEFMAANGIVYDPKLWARCTSCSGCTRGECQNTEGCHAKAAFCDARGGGGNDGSGGRDVRPSAYDFGDLLIMSGPSDCDGGRGNCSSCGGGFGNCS